MFWVGHVYIKRPSYLICALGWRGFPWQNLPLIDNHQPPTCKASEAPRQLAAANWQGTPPSGQPGAMTGMERKAGFWEGWEISGGVWSCRNNCKKKSETCCFRKEISVQAWQVASYFGFRVFPNPSGEVQRKESKVVLNRELRCYLCLWRHTFDHGFGRLAQTELFWDIASEKDQVLRRFFWMVGDDTLPILACAYGIHEISLSLSLWLYTCPVFGWLEFV